MTCIDRLNEQEKRALARVPLMRWGVRTAVRRWYRQRWEYLLSEYEKVLPHVDNLPPR